MSTIGQGTLRFDGRTIAEDPDAPRRLTGQMRRLWEYLDGREWVSMKVGEQFTSDACPRCACVATGLVTRNGSSPDIDYVASFVTDSGSWASRLIAQPFPATGPTLKAAEDAAVRSLTFSSVELTDSLGRMGLLDESLHHVVIQRDGGKAILTNKAADIGEMTDVIPCEGDFDGPIVLDHRFMAEMMRGWDDETIRFAIDTRNKPVIARSADRRVMHLLVPVVVKA